MPTSNPRADVETLNRLLKETNAGWEAKPFEEGAHAYGFTPGPDEPSLRERELLAQAKPEFGREVEGKTVRYPQSYDLRNVNGKNFITSVKSQGRCGSCVAFGATAAIEGTARVLLNDSNLNINLSEAHLFYCHGRAEGRHCGNGWFASSALRACQRVGVVDENCYPYRDFDQNCTNLCGDWQSRLVKITGWREIHSNSDMKTWLSTRGPLMAAFSVYQDFDYYSGGIYRYRWGGYEAGHLVCCVGYNDTERYWICKNSWGTGFGENGFFRIAYGQVGIDASMWAVEGIVGVNPQPGPAPGGWINGKLITALWAADGARNAWIHVDGVGWKRLAFTTDFVFLQLLNAAAAAKGARSTTNLLEEQGVITQIYVL